MSGSDQASPVNELDARSVMPVVPRSPSGVPTPLLVALLAVLAVGLFLLLDGRRRAQLAAQDDLPARSVRDETVPPLIIPPEPVAQPGSQPLPPVRVTVETPRPERAPRVTPSAPPVRTEPGMPAMTAPSPSSLPAPVTSRDPDSGSSLVLDLTSGPGATVNDAKAGDGAAAVEAGDDVVRATLVHGRSVLVPQGTIMAAVLETPLNSDRPGMARALVSRDVRGFDGTRVLIPRGSRLIGEFKADGSASQRRILVTWTRLIRPDGVAMRIGSPGSDMMGGAGVAGRVNTHFLARFTNAVLQSALAVGVNLASQASIRDGSVYVGIPTQAASQLGTQLIPGADRAPTIKVKEGAEIAIFVARDLDFGGTPQIP